MAERTVTRIGTDKGWPGRISNHSPHHLPPGAAADQVNLRAMVSGQLDVRGGLQPATFTNSQAAAASSVLSMYFYPTNGPSDYVVYELADGSIRAGKSPS